MARDAITLFARHDTTYKSQKWSSNVYDGDFRDGDKMLCKRCPLKHEVLERGRSEMIYEKAFKSNTAVGRPASTDTTDISDT